MNKSPAFQFYPKDFLMDDKVAVMNLEQIGAYMKLLCYCWNNNGLPGDEEELKEMCGNPQNWDKVWKKVGKCFYRNSGKLYNKRLDKEKEKQKHWKEKSSKGGTATQKKRWGEVPKETRGERLKRAREKGTHTSQEWEMLLKICEDKCVRCGIEKTKLHGEKLCKDHIVPICLGGSDSIKNIQPICRNCNTAKTNEKEDYRIKKWEEMLNQMLNQVATNGQSKHNPPSPFSSPSPIPSKIPSSKEIYPLKYESFWKNYPRKKEKKDAFFTWKELNQEQQEEVIIAAKNYADEMEAQNEEKKFIKHPKTFLNKKKEKWKDYLKPFKKAEKKINPKLKKFLEEEDE